MRIGFTGTQKGMTDFQKSSLIELFELKKPTEFIHGDCIGSDKEANDIAVDWGIKIFTIFPSTIIKKRSLCFGLGNYIPNAYTEFNYRGKIVQVKWMPKDEPLKRNKLIVDYCQHLIACPKEHTHTLRSGTWATIRYAWKCKKDITIIPPIIRED